MDAKHTIFIQKQHLQRLHLRQVLEIRLQLEHNRPPRVLAGRDAFYTTYYISQHLTFLNIFEMKGEGYAE